jgi:DNA-binding beta-propeller fold protein YncE
MYPRNALQAASNPKSHVLRQIEYFYHTRSGNPAWITFTPDSKTVYVSSCGVKTVTAIEVPKMKEMARITGGEMPDRISTLALP